MELIKSVHDILGKVEETTNKKVEFIEKNDLITYAAIKMARKSMPAHLVFHKREHNELVNHLIAHECGHILRMFAVPEEKRLIPMANQEIKGIALNEIQDEIMRLSKTLPLERLAQIINLWFDGIVRQVTNFPPDIMIEKWLYDEYPELRPYQLRSLQKQHQEAIAGLKDEVKEITPSKIINASNIMNYAFFRIIGFHIKNNFLTTYNQTPYVRKGKELAEYTEKNYIINDYEGDLQMINYWARFLGISNWFKWTGFEDVPENYLQTL
ncbi:MAG: hypothetical protein HXY44_17310 [Syntrophaceae bacterium]|nr:hypothetical protein [Syntrophaceae bacterium]